MSTRVYPRLANRYARARCLRDVQAWYQQARTTSLPPTTLLYSEDPVDFSPAESTPYPGDPRIPHINRSLNYPHLRTVGYLAGGVPMLYGGNILFANERLAWDPASSTNTSLSVVTISYLGLDPAGRPSFNYMLIRPITQIPILFHAGNITVPSAPARPLTHLRLYAGQPHPTDPARFAIPFQSDAGTGRFTFQLDTDPSDGGQVVPSVDIHWDPPPATSPASL